MLDHLFFGHNQQYNNKHTKEKLYLYSDESSNGNKAWRRGGGLWPSIPANSGRIFFGFPRESAYEISELYEYDCLNKLIFNVIDVHHIAVVSFSHFN